MAYDVSKKINLGQSKIMAEVINNIFLKKQKPQKNIWRCLAEP